MVLKNKTLILIFFLLPLIFFFLNKRYLWIFKKEFKGVKVRIENFYYIYNLNDGTVHFPDICNTDTFISLNLSIYDRQKIDSIYMYTIGNKIQQDSIRFERNIAPPIFRPFVKSYYIPGSLALTVLIDDGSKHRVLEYHSEPQFYNKYYWEFIEFESFLNGIYEIIDSKIDIKQSKGEYDLYKPIWKIHDSMSKTQECGIGPFFID